MQRIERTVVEGVGNGTVSVVGYVFARIKSEGSVLVEYVKDGITYVDEFEDERFIIPNGVTTLNVKASEKWEFHLQNSVPEKNLTELKIWKNGPDINILADDDIVFRGQGVPLETVDISDLRIDLETLSQLFSEALSSHTEEDAARYVKMKNAVISQ